MLSGASAFEISDIQEAKTEAHSRDDHDGTMLHRVENRGMEFLRTRMVKKHKRVEMA
jgi:hypothetical protein